MSYSPSIIDPTDEVLDLSIFMQSSSWRRIDFTDIKKDDRILAIRMYNGVRMFYEGVAFKKDKRKDTWVNSLGEPLVSSLDVHIFRAV